MNFPNATFDFIKYILGARKAFTHDTPDELRFLSQLADNKVCVIEVGVFEGVASSYLCRTMDPNGLLYLVDPYFKELKIEKILRFSRTELIAKRTLRPWRARVSFVKDTSINAANQLKLGDTADLIFIDARHDYVSVLEDFRCWASVLSNNGMIAFHDSRECEARPDLNRSVGPVQLCNEIAQGKHGNWKIVDHVDSITVISKTNADLVGK